MKIVVNNACLRLEYSNENEQLKKYINKQLHEEINPLSPDRFNSRAFRMHVWDGREKIFNNGKAPSGLFPDIMDCLKTIQNKYSFSFSVEDHRGKKLEAVHKVFPKNMKYQLRKGEPKSALRDHQTKGVQFAIDNQCGTVNYATASGKTAIIIATIGEILPKLKSSDRIFVMEQSVSLAEQMADSIKLALNIPVGIWGAGKQDIQQVTVGMPKTISSGLEDPEKSAKITSQKDKVTQHFTKDYVPLFINQSNAKVLIKTFLMNHQPRYKYDAVIFDDLKEMSKLPDKQIQKALVWQKNAYDKLMKKKAGKAYKRYNDTLDTLSTVRAVLVDEAHHAAASGYQKALLNMPNARMRMGFTGTIPSPKSDPVKWVTYKGTFSDNKIKVTNYEMISKGYAAKPTIKLVPIQQPTNLDDLVEKQVPANLPKSMEPLFKYQTAYKLGVVNNKFRNDLIALLTSKLVKLKNGPVLIIVNNIDHGDIIKDKLSSKGIDSLFIAGEKTPEEREDILNKIKNNESPVLIATKLLDEGLDIPNLKYLIYVSAGKSIKQVLQRVGRMLRKTSTKDSTTIFDLQDRTSGILYEQARKRLRIYKSERFDIK